MQRTMLLFFMGLSLAAPARQCVALCINVAKANLQTGFGTDYMKSWEVGKYMPFEKAGIPLSGDWYAVKDVGGHTNGMFVRQHGTVYTLALGDSANDEPLLREADAAVLLQKKDGSYDSAIQTPFIRSGAPGPAGWNEAVLRLLKERTLPIV